ncbi:MAG: DUF1697 domain-containing protein [Candidatus Paceibacterota bacterium]
MKYYVVLIRGINVGGKNKIPMSKLKICLEDIGFSNVTTYIASGNVIVGSNKKADQIKRLIEKSLPKYFKLDSNILKVLVLTKSQIQAVVSHKPKGFGDEPKKYHSDVIFLMEITATKAIKVFTPKEGVDKIWKGRGVVYSQRLSALRTKSRLNRIMMAPEYKSMTIRNWNTTTKLAQLMGDKS